MGKVESNKIVHHDAFTFSDSEAKTLHNSSGTKKGRLHLLTYDGIEGGERYAIVAERMTFDPGKERLGLWDRQFNILVKDDSGTWYKINKNSFLKRINPSGDLDVEEGTGICKNFKDLVKARSEALVKLQAKSNATTPFENEFLHQLSRSKDADAYKQIIFLPVEDNLLGPINTPVTGEPVLIITYDREDKKTDKSQFARHYGNWRHNMGQAAGVHINNTQYKKILSGHSIPRSIMSLIKNEKIDLEEGELQFAFIGSKLKFNKDTRPSDIEKFLAEQHVNFQRKSSFHLTKGIEEAKINADIDEDVDLDKIDLRSTKEIKAKIKDIPSFVALMKTALKKLK